MKQLSRAKRFEVAQNKASEARAEFEELRDELQNWRDNLPDNMQDGSKAEALDTAIEALEETINQCEEIEGASVEFPGMFGG